jgi:hypothetical protein
MDGLTEGRKVHYVMPNGQHRPADVVRVWNDQGMVNLQVQMDGSNDAGYTEAERAKLKDFGIDPEQVKHGHIWRTSIRFSEEPVPGTWHWIEKA